MSTPDIEARPRGRRKEMERRRLDQYTAGRDRPKVKDNTRSTDREALYSKRPNLKADPQKEDDMQEANRESNG